MKMKYYQLSMMLVAVLSLLSYSAFASGAEMADEASMLGQKAPEWTLKDYNGVEVSLQQILRKSDLKAVVVEFIATRCPVSKAYDKRMVELNAEYNDKGVVFVAINSNCNPMEPVEEMKKHAGDAGIIFPVAKDNDNVIADKYGAKVTPHIYLLDNKGIIKYIGRIDDNQDPGKVKSNDLKNAIDALLAGKEISSKHTKAFGCTIKRIKK